MKEIFAVILIFSFAHIEKCYSQVIEEWHQTYGGPHPVNILNDFTIDSSGNSYFAGYLSENNVSSITAFTIVKYSSTGNLQWVDSYQGSRNSLDEANAVVVNKSGKVYAIGTSIDIDSSENYCTIKYNSDGSKNWIRKFDFSRDYGKDICLDHEGNVYVTGYTYFSNPETSWINTIKYDSSGNLVWLARYNDNSISTYEKISITVDIDENVYISGDLSGNFCTIKYNSKGIQDWISYFDDSGNYDVPCDIKLDSNRNVYVMGKTFTSIYHDFYTSMVKYNNTGNEIWRFQTDSIGKYDSYFGLTMSFKIDSDNNSYLATTYRDNISLLKIDSNGTLLFNSKYRGYPDYVLGNGTAVDIDKNGFIYAGGSLTQSGGARNFCTLKYNSDGTILWVTTFHSSIPSDDESAFVNVYKNDNVYAAGSAYTTNNSIQKFCVVKYSQSVGINNINSEIPMNFLLQQNFPNPFNPKTLISYEIPVFNFVTIKIFDALGNEIMTLVNENHSSGKYETEFDGSNLASGIYFYKITAGNFSQTKRMVLIK